MLRSIELFAGGGGMAFGLHAAGFEHARLVEWDSRACDTLRLNARNDDPLTGEPVWDGEDVLHADVRHFAADRGVAALGDIDLVAGGPPCQPFSLGGVHAGHADERNMFPAALDVVRAERPKFVIFENVPGLLRPSFAPYFDYVEAQLRKTSVLPKPTETWQEHRDRLATATSSELRYRVGRQVVLAADLGVPQMRRRVFMIGIREDLGAEWIDIPTDHSEDALLHAQYVSGAYWQEHADDATVKRLLRRGLPAPPDGLVRRVARLQREQAPAEKRWRTVRDMLRDPEPLAIPADGRQRGRWPNHVGIPGARAYVGHSGSHIDLPAKTIKAGVHGVCGGEAMIRFHDDALRYMTTREAARVQGFPDWYEFTGARSHAMRHIGNAVAVRVAQAVGGTAPAAHGCVAPTSRACGRDPRGWRRLPSCLLRSTLDSRADRDHLSHVRGAAVLRHHHHPRVRGLGAVRHLLRGSARSAVLAAVLVQDPCLRRLGAVAQQRHWPGRCAVPSALQPRHATPNLHS